ncbi:MAG TPA: hypothetical protein VJL07_05675 [Dehalococcoidia bacterium]|nr:hypothetical protein [Dehalococcoidia bacterium]
MSLAEDLAKAPPWAVKIALGILLSLLAILFKMGVYDPWTKLGEKVDSIDRKVSEMTGVLSQMQKDKP